MESSQSLPEQPQTEPEPEPEPEPQADSLADETRLTTYVVLEGDRDKGEWLERGTYKAKRGDEARIRGLAHVEKLHASLEEADRPELGYFVAVPASSWKPKRPRLRVTWED